MSVPSTNHDPGSKPVGIVRWGRQHRPQARRCRRERRGRATDHKAEDGKFAPRALPDRRWIHRTWPAGCGFGRQGSPSCERRLKVRACRRCRRQTIGRRHARRRSTARPSPRNVHPPWRGRCRQATCGDHRAVVVDVDEVGTGRDGWQPQASGSTAVNLPASFLRTRLVPSPDAT